jgi:hypothetical protein
LFPLLTSWLSLALTVAAFNRAQRNSRQVGLKDLGFNEHYAGLKHQVLEMTWRLCETGGRVLCIAIFASVFKWWILAVLAPHGLAMLAWYCKKGRRREKLEQKWRDMEGDFSDDENRQREQWTMTKEEWKSFDDKMMEEKTSKDKGEETKAKQSEERGHDSQGGKKKKRDWKTFFLRAADFVLAIVSLFAFIGRTGIADTGFISMPNARIRYLVFYLVFYLENFTMMLCWWLLHGQHEGGVLNISLLAVGLSALPAHVALMLVYYKRCHPMAEYSDRRVNRRDQGASGSQVQQTREKRDAGRRCLPMATATTLQTRALGDWGRWKRELFYVDRMWIDTQSEPWDFRWVEDALCVTVRQ